MLFCARVGVSEGKEVVDVGIEVGAWVAALAAKDILRSLDYFEIFNLERYWRFAHEVRSMTQKTLTLRLGFLPVISV